MRHMIEDYLDSKVRRRGGEVRYKVAHASRWIATFAGMSLAEARVHARKRFTNPVHRQVVLDSLRLYSFPLVLRNYNGQPVACVDLMMDDPNEPIKINPAKHLNKLYFSEEWLCISTLSKPAHAYLKSLFPPVPAHVRCARPVILYDIIMSKTGHGTYARQLWVSGGRTPKEQQLRIGSGPTPTAYDRWFRAYASPAALAEGGFQSEARRLGMHLPPGGAGWVCLAYKQLSDDELSAFVPRAAEAHQQKQKANDQTKLRRVQRRKERKAALRLIQEKGLNAYIATLPRRANVSTCSESLPSNMPAVTRGNASYRGGYR